MADLFISHSSVDTEWTRELRHQLELAGYSCWMAPDDVNGPDPWAEQILEAIQACRVMLVVMSRAANASQHVSKEVGVALEENKPLLPIRMEDIAPTGSLNYLLQLVQWIDAFPGSIIDHVERIRRAVAFSIPPVPASDPAAAGYVAGPIDAAPLASATAVSAAAAPPAPPTPPSAATPPTPTPAAPNPWVTGQAPPPPHESPTAYPGPAYGQPSGYQAPTPSPYATTSTYAVPSAKRQQGSSLTFGGRAVALPLMAAVVGVVALGVVAVAALGGAFSPRPVATALPSVLASPIGTQVAVSLPPFSLAPTAIPSASSDPTPAPTFAPTRSPAPSAVADLSALLPDHVDGVVLARESLTGDKVFGTDSSSQAMRAFLASVGKSEHDLQLADARDSSSSSDIGIYAFHLPGVDPVLHQQALITSGFASSEGAEITHLTLGGRDVVQISGSSMPSAVYIYSDSGVVFGVQGTDDTLVTHAIAATPVQP